MGGRLNELRVNQGPNLLMLTPLRSLPSPSSTVPCLQGGEVPDSLWLVEAKMFILNRCSSLSPTLGCCNWG